MEVSGRLDLTGGWAVDPLSQLHCRGACSSLHLAGGPYEECGLLFGLVAVPVQNRVCQASCRYPEALACALRWASPERPAVVDRKDSWFAATWEDCRRDHQFEVPLEAPRQASRFAVS